MGRSLLSWWIIALAAAQAAHAAGDSGCTKDLVLDSSSMTIDRKTNLFRLGAPRITRCNMTIEADEALATGVDFNERSEWRFTGHVRINVDSALLQADSAVFTFDADRLARGELQGNASLTDRSAEHKEPVQGGASKLIYDYVAQTLRLTDHAWINKGNKEIQGCDLIYDFNDERVTSGSADCGESGFRIRVLQQAEETPNRADPAP
jgi:lipopolysaccharide transport protein LptA